MKKLIHIFWVIILILAQSCQTILEYPEEGKEVDPTRVNVELNLALDIEMYLEYGTLTRSVGDNMQIRSIVEIYEEYDLENPIIRDVHLTNLDVTDFKLSANYELHARRYKILVWSDYVEQGGNSDNHYATPNLRFITHSEPYRGNVDTKNAFNSNLDIDLTPYVDEWNIVIDAVMQLEKPFGKFQLITTDIEEFITRVRSKSDTKAEIADYSVKVLFAGYMPYGYSVMSGKPNEALQGISYDSKIEVLSENEGCMTFDYVFVNGEESAVNIVMQVFDKDGQLVQETNNISVPIKRGALTTIKDEFLTGSYVPGIGINPEFDGEINIVIPD